MRDVTLRSIDGMEPIHGGLCPRCAPPSCASRSCARARWYVSGPDQLRQILPGREGIRLVAIGGSPVRSSLVPGRSSVRTRPGRRPANHRPHGLMVLQTECHSMSGIIGFPGSLAVGTMRTAIRVELTTWKARRLDGARVRPPSE
jgi:hypothetical protein